MPLGFTALSTALASTSNTATYAGNAGTPAAGELLICFVIASGNTTGNLTGTFTWNLLTQFTRPASDQIYVFWAYASSATSVTPTFNSTSGNATGCIISAVRVTGAEGQTQPYLRQFKTLTNTNTNPAVTMDSAILTGNGCLAFATNIVNSTTQWTAPASWTELSEVAYNTPTNSGQTCFRVSGETGTTLTWTNANAGQNGIIVLEFYSAGGGPQADNSSYGFFGGNINI